MKKTQDPEKTRALIALKMLALPRSKWTDSMSYKWTPKTQADWISLVDFLDDTAQRAAQLAQYVSMRQGCDGCGPKTHGDAVKEANRKLEKVRKALGYSYPKSGIFPF